MLRLKKEVNAVPGEGLPRPQEEGLPWVTWEKEAIEAVEMRPQACRETPCPVSRVPLGGCRGASTHTLSRVNLEFPGPHLVASTG